MNIVHLPVNSAGQAGITARAQKEIGHNAINISYDSYFNYKSDIFLKHPSSERIRCLAERLNIINYIKNSFDVFHYHSYALLNIKRFKMIDAKALKKMNKRIVVEFWGSDVRLQDVEKQRNPFYINSVDRSDTFSRDLMKRWSDITEGEVIFPDQTFNLYLKEYFTKIHNVRQRVDISKFKPLFPNPNNKIPRIVHAPTKREYKGTKYLEKAIENLKKKKLKFEYIIVEKMTSQRAAKIYESADIIVDQLCGGNHGVFACEAMALGKPVICYILPEHLDGYPEGFPIINANPLTIESVLEEWILRHEDRYSLGIKSREYAERVHDSKKVAADLINIYKNVEK